MALSRNSLRGFLACAKVALHTADEQCRKVTLVIGNESADLDSLTSSVLLAYIRSSKPPSTSLASYPALYIPLTNIPAADISLRPEYTALFQHANIESSHLITLDDLAPSSRLAKRLQPENTRVVLVDHNVLQGSLGDIYSKCITGCIDHHDDEDKVPKNSTCEPRIIDKCGSCTSLVVNYCRSAWDQLTLTSLTGSDDDVISRKWDAQVAKFALASILVDTANLTSESKVTEHDIEAVKYLESKIRLSPHDAAVYSRQAFYDDINAAKLNIDTLHLKDILRKDYKLWTENLGVHLGISSVVRPLSFLVKKARDEGFSNEKGLDPFLAAVGDFAQERDLGIYAIMTSSTSNGGEFQRELLVWANGNNPIEAAKRFEDDAQNDLRLDRWEDSAEGRLNVGCCGHDTSIRVWRQRGVGKSRKQVAPLLRKAMNQHA